MWECHQVDTDFSIILQAKNIICKLFVKTGCYYNMATISLSLLVIDIYLNRKIFSKNSYLSNLQKALQIQSILMRQYYWVKTDFDGVLQAKITICELFTEEKYCYNMIITHADRQNFAMYMDYNISDNFALSVAILA